ncbi:hypothetical protein HPB49_006853 [Dermacentor silvarum]|uniref:Uncharacterized protein n=1 Tax=Dermacentor silvarum TaxID=543639 RepID=A0ACB8DW05_DERSI|nr:hypothetical protein HPB49_006853 [Dermacentor silvarum]
MKNRWIQVSSPPRCMSRALQAAQETCYAETQSQGWDTALFIEDSTLQKRDSEVAEVKGWVRIVPGRCAECRRPVRAGGEVPLVVFSVGGRHVILGERARLKSSPIVFPATLGDVTWLPEPVLPKLRLFRQSLAGFRLCQLSPLSSCDRTRKVKRKLSSGSTSSGSSSSPSHITANLPEDLAALTMQQQPDVPGGATEAAASLQCSNDEMLAARRPQLVEQQHSLVRRQGSGQGARRPQHEGRLDPGIVTTSLHVPGSAGSAGNVLRRGPEPGMGHCLVHRGLDAAEARFRVRGGQRGLDVELDVEHETNVIADDEVIVNEEPERKALTESDVENIVCQLRELLHEKDQPQEDDLMEALSPLQAQLMLQAYGTLSAFQDRYQEFHVGHEDIHSLIYYKEPDNEADRV